MKIIKSIVAIAFLSAFAVGGIKHLTGSVPMFAENRLLSAEVAKSPLYRSAKAKQIAKISSDGRNDYMLTLSTNDFGQKEYPKAYPMSVELPDMPQYRVYFDEEGPRVFVWDPNQKFQDNDDWFFKRRYAFKAGDETMSSEMTGEVGVLLRSALSAAADQYQLRVDHRKYWERVKFEKRHPEIKGMPDAEYQKWVIAYQTKHGWSVDPRRYLMELWVD